jgi:hypothetical protein
MSEWTQETWGLFFDLLDKGWPGHLDPGADRAYQLLLDGTDPDRVVQGLRRLLHRGARFRPSAAEILDAGRQDPGRPTFAEATRLIFGARGVLQARPEVRRYNDAGERDRLYNEAALERAAGMHPLIGAFIQAQGLDRLRALNLQDPEYGELRRRELEAEWDALVERIDDREIALDALPAGDARRGQLASFDPLAVLAKRRPTMLPPGDPQQHPAHRHVEAGVLQGADDEGERQ